MNNNLFELDCVTQIFNKPDGSKQKILDKITLNIKVGEVIAVLGKSGCGKSTLLRIIAGITCPSKGKIKFYQDDDEESFGISMVFQTFALFPWMTVLENVELGLESMNIPKDARKARALAAIDLIGLDGFESAYPRELSGGMQQRVGFARALVVNPEILLMDEPFSSLDALTSDTLKNDFLDLWISKKTSLKAVVIVTHSIEEAVLMADRIIILGSSPGHIASEFKVQVDRPRNSHRSKFQEIVDKVYIQMANANQKSNIANMKTLGDAHIGHKLPLISPNQLAALASTLSLPPFKGTADLAELVKTLHLSTEEIFLISEGLIILKLASESGGQIKLNKEGKILASADSESRKMIFGKYLMRNVPLAAYIVRVLQERPGNKAPKRRFQSHLEDYLTHEDANITIKTIIAWGRYGEIFSYDDSKQIFSLDNPEA